MSKLLEVENLSVNYGPITALQKISFDLEEGEILSLIGANGAGKSTLLRTISGLQKPTHGEIRFRHAPITDLPPHEIVKRRVIHVPEGRGIFLNLTVRENLDLGAFASPDPSLFEEDLEYVHSLFPKLKDRQNQIAGTLSGGELQMLAIGRALMAHPKLLMLDEPSLGLAPQMIEAVFETVQSLHEEGMSILLVEQNAVQALEISQRAIVLELGKITHQGHSKNLLTMQSIREAYLGVD